MTAPVGLIRSIEHHVGDAGRQPPAVRALARWKALAPRLARYASPAEIVEDAHRAAPHERDVVLGALLAVTPGDQWAQLTALAVLAPRLSWVVSRWARHPDARVDLADLEAELVAECLALLASPPDPLPPQPGLALVDTAWAKVRNARARHLRHLARTKPLPPLGPPTAGSAAPPQVHLAAVVNEAVSSGELAISPARALYLTRVMGLSTAETARSMGTSPDAVRALRSRAARQLAA